MVEFQPIECEQKGYMPLLLLLFFFFWTSFSKIFIPFLFYFNIYFIYSLIWPCKVPAAEHGILDPHHGPWDPPVAACLGSSSLIRD